MNAKKQTEEASSNESADAGEKEEHELTEEERKEKALESYRQAGKIAREALKKGVSLCKPGKKVIDLIEEVEGYIIEEAGETGGIGFPMNVSINNVAAHYTSGPRDFTEIEEGMMVKLDLGVHVEGYVADHATTINLSDDPALENLPVAAEESMEAAIGMLKVGAKTHEIGSKIYEIIKSYNYNPIRDLSGHSLERWIVHGQKQVPLIPVPTGNVIDADDVIAIETFASTGEGQTHPQNYGNIFQLMITRTPKIRNKSAKRLIGFIAKNFKTLPFCHRTWSKEIAVPRFALNELINSGIIMEHKILSDIKGSYVAQSERTVYIHEGEIEILT
ncbi:type II methionyl aminopeptidase [Candidatus Bathyarchaeota archaeon]|nr:type II methionyl aminopeptidase [Candidatus Bathyarchaeota archaeon]